MNLKLDEAYADYLYWRSELLRQGTPYVAEFPTHSLLYGTVRHTFTFLEPGKDYMIYAFVVNATNNKPDGRLFTHYVSTESESLFEGALQFEYRVRGYWDYKGEHKRRDCKFIQSIRMDDSGCDVFRRGQGEVPSDTAGYG